MPYIIKKVHTKDSTGFKVCKKDEPKECFSKAPLPFETARKQRIAIVISEHRRTSASGGAAVAAPKGPKGPKPPCPPKAPKAPAKSAVTGGAQPRKLKPVCPKKAT